RFDATRTDDAFWLDRCRGPARPSAGAEMTAAPDADPYAQWDSTLQTLVDSGGTAMVIGGSDVGKTTFCRLFVNRAVAANLHPAILDSDPGQSEIGPPGCAGLAFAGGPVPSLS